jgi:hypothetical protein
MPTKKLMTELLKIVKAFANLIFYHDKKIICINLFLCCVNPRR